MDAETFHRSALALQGATVSIKWGNDRVYSVGDKMFAAVGPTDAADPRYSFKASEIAYEHLIEQGLARPAPYLARARWVQLARADALDDESLRLYLAEAHRLVAKGLTHKARSALGLDD